MTRESLRFEELRIRRMPGFENEGFALSELSPGINLIHGPNGSGKSTTARAIERLLWPALVQAERISLAGRFHLAGEWMVDVDGSRVHYQREGAEAEAPLLPSGVDRQRYRLSLHDLLHERDESFAQAVISETAGGYNVRSAGAVLEPRDVPTRRSGANEELDRAREEWQRAVAAQQDLSTSELQLRELRDRREAAERALARMAVLESAQEHAEAREAEAHARAELARFPEGMGKVGGDEYERLCKLRDRLRTIADEMGRAAYEQSAARATIEASGLPESALGEEVLGGLDQDLAALREAERDLAAAAQTREAAATRLREEQGRIAGVVNPERLAALGDVAMGSLTGFARRAGDLEAARKALEAQLRLLEGPGSVEDAGRLEDGIRILQRWLRVPAPVALERGAGRAAGLAAALLLVLLGIALGVLVSPLYVVVAVAGMVLLWPLLRAPRGGGSDARDVHRIDYGKLELDPPAAWEPGEVERLLEGLHGRALAARVAAERELRRRELADRLHRQEEEERELEAERAEVARRLGVAPEIDAAALAWLTDGVSRWQAAHAEVSGGERACQVAREQASSIAEAMRSRLEPLGFASLSTSGELAGAIQAFQQRRQALELARQGLASAERDQRRLLSERREKEEEMGKLFSALALDIDTDETVRDWCARHAEYVRVRDSHRDAATTLRGARARMTVRGGDEALAQRTVAELEMMIAAERERGAARDLLADKISRTETRVEAAKRSHGIEQALERIERAENALRQARERDTRGVIARELLGYLERATRDQHLPEVFHRAREIFTRITHGRYELRLRQVGEPEFTAFDNLDRRGRTLDELSSGSRVQLLIAVRVAFVERQEQGVVLPLVLDEVLGNSDDERARAIMEATLELAREGRQIFYFTAQADEVARWRAMAGAASEGVDVREIDLLRARGVERALEIPALVPAARRRPPEPGEADHAEYGRRLGVPRLDRAITEPGSVHLWYLVEEPELLHRLLLLGPDRWGALEALVRDGGRPLVDDRLFEQLALWGRAVEAFIEAARIGVGLPVDRAVLEDSEAVTAVFLDRIDELARSLGGDGSRLLEALEAGEVARFGRASKDRLREYLEEWGYCPPDQPLDLPEIRVRVLARVAPEIAAQEVSVEQLDRLLGRLWVGVGGE